MVENAQVRAGSSNNYELIFPNLLDEEKTKKYESLLKKANDIWDEFTTGAKGKKKTAEQAAEKEKADNQARRLLSMKKESKQISSH